MVAAACPAPSSTKATKQRRQPPTADRKDAVDRRPQHDFPAPPGTLAPNLVYTAQVHRPLVVDAVEVTMLDCGHHFTERPDVTERPPAASPDDGLVTIGLQVVDNVGLNGESPVIPEVQKYAVQR